jgi:hypothetical protein
MVMMLNKRGEEPTKRRGQWSATPALRKDPQMTVMSVTIVTAARTPYLSRFLVTITVTVV